MNIGRFAEGYRRDDIDVSSQDRNLIKSASKSLMQGPQKWSHFFSGVAQNYLEGDSDDLNDIKTNLVRYGSHSVQQSIQNTTGLMREYAYHFPSLGMLLNSLNFHTINGEMVRYWDRLIDGEHQPAPDRIDITATQTRLGIRAMQLVAVRRDFQQRSREVGVASPIDGSLAGQITEIDAGVAMLEFLKNLPPEERDRIVLMPAPANFDYGASEERSFDYLMVDIEGQEARGIQVATNFRGAQKSLHAPYDSDFITKVDGIEDLKNFVGGHLGDDGQTGRKATPGLLSADFLLTTPTINRLASAFELDELKGYKGMLIDARTIAREVMPVIVDEGRIGRLAGVMGERILTDLYK